jgi:hypothetical protein
MSMVRVALVFALAGLAAAAVPAPGLYLAIGLGIAAIGLGWLGWRRRDVPGPARIGAAAAMTLGGAAFALGALRVAMVLVAIEHVQRMLG